MHAKIHQKHVFLFCNGPQVQLFNLLPRPGSSTQEFQTGFDAGIFSKTFYGDAASQSSPAVLIDKPGEDHFKRNSMQGIIGLGSCHSLQIFQVISRLTLQ